jgi:hypothetical protein
MALHKLRIPPTAFGGWFNPGRQRVFRKNLGFASSKNDFGEQSTHFREGQERE